MRSHVAAGALYLVLALGYTYPLPLALSRANRFDSPDALLSAWTLSWDLHQLRRAPLHVFEANIFFPEHEALAYSENLLAAALLVAPLRLFTDNPILLLNAALLGALVASGLATFVLARELGRSWCGAFLAGLLFAFAPFRWAHVPHLQLQLAFPLPLTFYFARRLAARRGWTAVFGFAASVALAFASSGYYAVTLLSALPLFIAWDVKRYKLSPLIAAALLGAALSLPLVAPYAVKLREGSRRTLEEAAQYGAGPSEYASSFSRLHFFLPKSPEPLFPGFAALGLSLLALAKQPKRNDWLLAATAAVGVGLSSFTVFSLLYRVVPAYQGLRVPSRAGILFLLAVALLASAGLSRVGRAWARALAVVLAAAECYAGPLPWSFEVPVLPGIYAQVAEREEPGALIEIPLPAPEQFQLNAVYMYRSLFHWRPLVNGYSGFVPGSYRDIHLRLSADFHGALSHLHDLGVNLLLAHGGRLGPRAIRQIEEAERLGRLRLLAQVEGDRLYAIQP